MDYRPLSGTGIVVSEVALGCWPIAGLTSPGTSDSNSLATIEACFDLGINHLDTAYCYGDNGESERLIARAVEGRRDAMVIATKGGQHRAGGKLCVDGSPAALRRECEESLCRLRTDYVDLYYLHQPDPSIPIDESAGALRQLLQEGKIRAVGVSNVSLAQLEAFAAVCLPAAVQLPYNMLLREIEADLLPWCRRHGVAVMAYWPLMKGLLTGRIAREQVFGPDDSRRNYRQFQPPERQKNHDLVDRLARIAETCGHTVAELVVRWTLDQPGITSTLCGAKRPEQIRETAGGALWRLSPDQRAKIDDALAERQRDE